MTLNHFRSGCLDAQQMPLPSRRELLIFHWKSPVRSLCSHPKGESCSRNASFDLHTFRLEGFYRFRQIHRLKNQLSVFSSLRTTKSCWHREPWPHASGLHSSRTLFSEMVHFQLFKMRSPKMEWPLWLSHSNVKSPFRWFSFTHPCCCRITRPCVKEKAP